MARSERDTTFKVMAREKNVRKCFFLSSQCSFLILKVVNAPKCLTGIKASAAENVYENTYYKKGKSGVQICSEI